MSRAAKDPVGCDIQKLSEEVAEMRIELSAHICELRCLLAELQELQDRFNKELALLPEHPQRFN